VKPKVNFERAGTNEENGGGNSEKTAPTEKTVKRTRIKGNSKKEANKQRARVQWKQHWIIKKKGKGAGTGKKKMPRRNGKSNGGQGGFLTKEGKKQKPNKENRKVPK